VARGRERAAWRGSEADAAAMGREEAVSVVTVMAAAMAAAMTAAAAAAAATANGGAEASRHAHTPRPEHGMHKPGAAGECADVSVLKAGGMFKRLFL